MLFKWIVCHVPDNKRETFALAQDKWAGMANIPGFIGQAGGWDLMSKKEACILAIWQDAKAYESFMDEHHDRIFQAIGQAATFDRIDVAVLEPIYNMPGSKENIAEGLSAAKLIRVADCFLRPDRTQHFNEVQEEIWIPGIAGTKGLLAGSFNKVSGSTDRYIFTTLWDSMEAHLMYVQTVLPELERESFITQDVDYMKSHLISLRINWLVIKAPVDSSSTSTQ